MALRMILNRRKQEQTRARLAAVGKKEAELRARAPRANSSHAV